MTKIAEMYNNDRLIRSRKRIKFAQCSVNEKG
jgi:hypothetical protein